MWRTEKHNIQTHTIQRIQFNEASFHWTDEWVIVWSHKHRDHHRSSNNLINLRGDQIARTHTIQLSPVQQDSYKFNIWHTCVIARTHTFELIHVQQRSYLTDDQTARSRHHIEHITFQSSFNESWFIDFVHLLSSTRIISTIIKWRFHWSLLLHNQTKQSDSWRYRIIKESRINSVKTLKSTRQ